MTHRSNTEIRTKYKTIEECIENCRDIKEERVFANGFARQIYGVVNEDGTFKLRCRQKTSNMFVYEGKIEQRADGIYMTGDITALSSYKIFLFVVTAMFAVWGVFSMQSSEPASFLTGVVFLAVSAIYMVILYKFDGLYKNLVKKVT